MKVLAIAAGVLVISAPALGDVGVSIGINQPGFYGQINIGDYPRPTVVYEQPVIVQRRPDYAEVAPIYLHVPPGHEKHWDKHCGEYNACGRRVLFVQDGWYRNEFARHQQQGAEGRKDKGHGKGNKHEDRGDRGDRGERGDRRD